MCIHPRVHREDFLKLVTEDIVVNLLVSHLVGNQFTRLEVDLAHLEIEEPHVVQVFSVQGYPKPVCLS